MKRLLSKLFVCLVLFSLMGAPIRIEEIEELMSAMNQQKIERTIPEEEEKDDPIKKFLTEVMSPSRPQ